MIAAGQKGGSDVSDQPLDGKIEPIWQLQGKGGPTPCAWLVFAHPWCLFLSSGPFWMAALVQA